MGVTKKNMRDPVCRIAHAPTVRHRPNTSARSLLTCHPRRAPDIRSAQLVLKPRFVARQYKSAENRVNSFSRAPRLPGHNQRDVQHAALGRSRLAGRLPDQHIPCGDHRAPTDSAPMNQRGAISNGARPIPSRAARRPIGAAMPAPALMLLMIVHPLPFQPAIEDLFGDRDAIGIRICPIAVA